MTTPTVEMPTLRGPVVIAGSLPFRSAHDADSSLFFDLASVGYVEEEYFLDGRADAHDADGNLLAEAAPYVTRMLVRRPADPERFSGTVHLEPLHNLQENSPTWNVSRGFLTRRGHAWIGVTVSAGTFMPAGTPMGGGIAQLQHADARRYGELSLLAFDTPPPRAAPVGPGGYDVEEMRWNLSMATAHGAGVVAGVGALVRGNHRSSPLAGYEVQRVDASGWSQTGLFWANFLDWGYHEVARGASSTRAIDGYLIAVAPGPAHHPVDAPLVNLLSEAEVVGTLNPGAGVADDSDTPPFRGYEVPGTFHLWNLAFGGPFRTADHGVRHNDRSWYLLVHALLDGLDEWTRGGKPLPHAPRITRDPGAPDGVARDEHGNALGGVRTAWVDVPSARYLARCECSPTVGEMRVFDDATIARLHGSDDAHRSAWALRVDAMHADRWLLAEDAAELRATPE